MEREVKFGAKAAQKRRQKLREEFWPGERAWLFCSLRTLPYILLALRDKGVSGKADPSTVYVELLAHHMGDGVVELLDEDDHAYASGYAQPRTWRDRMNVLERAGFIKATQTGNRKFGKVLLVHPLIAMRRLRENELISDHLWTAYRSRASSTGETDAEEARDVSGALIATG
jgi:hypothetical protein